MDPQTLLTHGDFVRALARSLLADEHRADDVTQQTWLAALEHEPREAGLRSWLATVARNFARQSARGEGRRASRERGAARSEQLASAADVVAREAARRRVVDAVLALDEPYRAAILARFFDQLPPREMARRLGVPVETARTRVKRGLDQLRARLDGEFGGDRHAWSAAIAPIAWAPASTAVLLGASMTATKTVTLVAAIVLLAGLAVWWSSDRAPLPTPRTGVAAHDNPALARASNMPTEARPVADAREVLSSQPAGSAAEPRRFRGRVVDRLRRPVPGASVVVYPCALEALAERKDTATERSAVRATTANAEGRFEIALDGALAERGPFAVFAEASGFAPGSVDLVGEDEEPDVELQPQGVLVGRVLDLDDHPVAGARLRWRGAIAGCPFEREADSADDGTFALAGLPSLRDAADFSRARRFMGGRLDVEAAGFAPRSSNVLSDAWGISPDAEGRVCTDFYLVRGATYEGRAVDAETKVPIAGAHVQFWTGAEFNDIAGPGGRPLDGPNPSRLLGEATTRGDGGFTIAHAPIEGQAPTYQTTAMPRGRIGFVGVVASGYAPEIREAEVAADGETVSIEIPCRRAGSIRGRVVDASGGPVTGARVTISWPYIWCRLPRCFEGSARLETRTDTEGRYELTSIPEGTVRIVGFRPEPPGREHLAQSPTVMVVAGKTLNGIDLTMRDRFSAVIEVVDAKGAPVAGAGVSWLEDHQAITTTDTFGLARLFFHEEGLYGPQPPEAHRAYVRARGYAVALSPDFIASVSAPPRLRVALESERRVAGLVTRADGTSASEAMVFVLNGAIPTDKARSAEMAQSWKDPSLPKLARYGQSCVRGDGSFEVRGLPPGPYHVVAVEATEGWQSTADPKRARAILSEVVADSLNLRLALSPAPVPPDGVSIPGTVRDRATGRPVSRASVFLRRGETTAFGKELAPGRFRVEGVTPGTWSLTARAAGYIELRREFVVASVKDAPVPLALLLDRGVRVRGRVVITPAPSEEERQELDGSPLVFASAGFPEVQVSVGAGGTFEASGLQPGATYSASVLSRELGLHATQFDERLVLRPDDSEVTRDLRLSPATVLAIAVRSPRLPSSTQFGLLQESSDAQRSTAAHSRLEVLDAVGRRVWERDGLRSPMDVTLPFGDYIVRALVDGAPPQEKSVKIPGKGRPEVSFDVP